VGKGTQCSRLANHLALPHLSTGEMLRAAKANAGQNGCSMSRALADHIDAGQLAPDELVMTMLVQRMAQPDCERGCLFDGFPRTLSQGQLLDEHLVANGHRVSDVVNLKAPRDVLIQRLLRRGETENRADDTLETIEARLLVFMRETAPLLDHYDHQGVVRTVDGTGTPDEVCRRVIAKVSRSPA